MRGKMPVGIDDFGKIREKDYYFVDKTDFIRQLIDGHSDVTLITRPRRFGKTLTLSMLEWFFSIEKSNLAKPLFEGLSIEKAGNSYMQEQGRYPVIFLSLKDIKNPSWHTWPRMLDFIRFYFAQIYVKYQYLADSDKVDENSKRLFQRIVHAEATEDELTYSLTGLMKMMYAHYGKKVILLIDEYDVPIQQSWENGYYTGCIGFMRQFLSSALKTNDTLEFAVLTGVLRVAKESIFSGLNNLDVCTVTSPKYSDVFGFTQQEVHKMAYDFGEADKLPEIQKWYDGYYFATQDIYNPWSVNNYFKQHGEAEAYWVNTSGNDIIHTLLAQADEERWEELRALLTGGTVQAVLQEGVIYNTIGENSSDLYTLLLQTGYLKAIGSMKIDDTRIYELAIPNREIRSLFQSEIMRGVDRSYGMVSFYKMGLALQQGNAETFQRILQGILRRAVSAHDAAKPESFYHGLMLGCALFYEKDYRVRSNRESGYGRFDLAMLPKHVSLPGVIMEFKAVKAEEELEQAAQEACQQIETKAYVTELESAGCPHIWYYGIAFCKKHVLIRMG